MNPNEPSRLADGLEDTLLAMAEADLLKPTDAALVAHLRTLVLTIEAYPGDAALHGRYAQALETLMARIPSDGGPDEDEDDEFARAMRAAMVAPPPPR